MKVFAVRNNEHTGYLSVEDEKGNQLMEILVSQPKCDETRRLLVINPKVANFDIYINHQ